MGNAPLSRKSIEVTLDVNSHLLRHHFLAFLSTVELFIIGPQSPGFGPEYEL